MYCLNVAGAYFLGFFLQGRQNLIPSRDGRVKECHYQAQVELLEQNGHYGHVIDSQNISS